MTKFERAVVKLRTQPIARQEYIMEAALTWCSRPGAPYADEFASILAEFRAAPSAVESDRAS
jgi:hypothetical protein